MGRRGGRCFRNPRTGVMMRRKAHGRGFTRCRGR